MMQDYSYENSLEWVPREYPTDDEFLAYSGYIDYSTPQAAGRQTMQPVATQAQQWPQRQQPAYRPRQALQGKAIEQRMSKADALNLLESLKSAILAGALIVFVALSALVATHAVGNAANSSPGPSFNPSQQQGPSDDGGGFFDRHDRGDGGGGGQPSSGTHVS